MAKETTYKLADHLHYERNADGELQSIYFDVDEEFKAKLADLVSRESARIVDEGETSLRNLLVGVRDAVDRELGPLTLPQMLLFAHNTAGRIAFNHDNNVIWNDGFKAGQKSVIDMFNSRNSTKKQSKQAMA